MTAFETDLAAAVGPDRVQRNVPLAAFTTFRVGGAARWLIETRTSDEIERLLGAVYDNHL